ncbi:hypothetical protein [Geomicrobium sp. JCM 19039]|uniref:hypothetical protein n=1 Tax=Geomicrobium sp. JCM 19039 TaxID=1460636 RepID=UPI00045F3180|nr:hypothetical protein [Geomicrobium sp. JCM 19039]GAK13692.1 hypothetical protein JCM19039_3559 [Geomicrobium sp. JCM 19039]
MLIIFDECLGIEESRFNWSQAFRSTVKPSFVGKDRQRLTDFLHHANSPLIAKSVNLHSYSIQEDVTYFHQIASEHDVRQLVYFYDPHYSITENLYRVRNWLLPEIEMLFIPVKANLPEIFFLLESLNQKGSATIKEISSHIQRGILEQSSWLITTNRKKLLTKEKKNKLYRQKEAKDYQLVRIDGNSSTQLKVQQKGSLEQLWNLIVDNKRENDHVYVVENGLSFQYVGADTMVTLDRHMLPLHIPFVQIMLSKNLYENQIVEKNKETMEMTHV